MSRQRRLAPRSRRRPGLLRRGGQPTPAGTRRPSTGVHRPPRDPPRLVIESALIGLAVGIAVIAPWTRGGYLLLLDWVSGPQQAATPGLYGLDPTALDVMPYRIATQVGRHIFGAQATAWLMVLLYFPIAAAGISTLARGGRWRRHCAAAMVVCNPFMVDRIRAGHIGFLLSVALLPWLLRSAIHARQRGKWFAARPAGWFALAISVSPHAAWLGGACLAAVALLPRPRLVDLCRTALISLTACGVYFYAVVVLLAGVHTMQVTDSDLNAYATRPGPGGLLPTVASLHGFWRQSGGPTSRPVAVWSLLAIVGIAVVAGLIRLCRTQPELGAPLVALVITGLGLGAGIHGPLGTVYHFAFDHLPLFEAMREQQKWVALAMIGYAVAIGATVEALVVAVNRSRDNAAGNKRQRAQRRLAAVAGLLAVATLYGAVAPSLVWGLGGRITVSEYPQSWYAADRIMGTGSGMALFLPWHGYQPFTFTEQRTVATPASAFFRRPVLSSDAVEIGTLTTNSVSRRMAYVQRLVADAGGGHFGQLVAPLGVEYVALARDREASQYGWLADQPDLKPVLRTAEIDLYRVEPAATGRVVSTRQADYADALRLAANGDLGTEALLTDAAPGGPLPSTRAGRIRRTSSTTWRIAAGDPGWVVVPEEYSAGWRVGRQRARPTTAGTVALAVTGDETVVRYAPWRYLRLGILASVLFFLALVAAGLVEHRRELYGWWSLHRPGRHRRGAVRPPVPPGAGRPFRAGRRRSGWARGPSR